MRREQVIRNEKALTSIREYIENNPLAEQLNWNELDIPIQECEQ
jgi:hypothetical protein